MAAQIATVVRAKIASIMGWLRTDWRSEIVKASRANLTHWVHEVQKRLKGRSQQPTESADYQAWRHRFLSERLQLCLWIAMPCFVTIVLQNCYELFLNRQSFDQDVIQFFGNPDLPDRMRHLTMLTNAAVGILLTACLILRHTQWGQRHPAILFLCFSWSVTLAPQMIGTHLRLPDGGDGAWFLVFLVQATLMPVRWRLHLISQLGALAYYVGVNPLLGLTTIEGRSIYSAGLFILLFWFCFICDLAVYLYERLQQAEFESRRELKVFLHAVSHDLRTPVMGTAIVLQNLLKKAKTDEVTISKQVVERLLQGSDRQLALIHSLLEAHETEIQKLVLHRQAIDLSPLVEAVLTDLEPTLLKNQIVVQQHLSRHTEEHLPQIEADPTQIWRVYSNLITNAIKHNPHGIQISLEAEITDSNHLPRYLTRARRKQPKLLKQFARQARQARDHQAPTQPHSDQLKWLCCTVSDNGIGIPAGQRERLFELYARGSRARYMPGLGLGLYLCQQIISAHGGEIGVISPSVIGSEIIDLTKGSTRSSVNSTSGTTFWFTLPLAPLES